MRIGPTQRLGINLPTTWGTYPSPFFTAPEQNTRVMEYIPDTIQGRHQFRTQPRTLSLLPPDPLQRGASDVLARTQSSLVPDSPDAHGVGAVETETKVALYIFIGIVGAVALLSGGTK
jgi:hypothetical protein